MDAGTASMELDTSIASRHRTAAFDIPELQEAIFLRLPPQDVILATCVYTHWNNLISNSTAINKHMHKVTDLDLFSRCDGREHGKQLWKEVAYVNFGWGTVVVRLVNKEEYVYFLPPKNAQTGSFSDFKDGKKLLKAKRSYEDEKKGLSLLADWRLKLVDVETGRRSSAWVSSRRTEVLWASVRGNVEVS